MIGSGRDGTEYGLREVALEEHACLSRRLVTPTYGADANLTMSAVHAANMRMQRTKEESKKWERQRPAVIHTTDVSSKFSTNAEEVVRRFRHTVCMDSINFHIGDVNH
ncbi:hypothetical protein GCG54_00011667 [Colletotrichum gloeosporioides]|uniref:Uncharacterized protein n=1 Tax=Colletotrichum gloeosporioides TaxID=474922 RepID=A0A8H4CH28_COLGL|nr:uncharacterized protein GCG54_00011667 [Colletotrichum gloeosporioides]KAF3803828.1 hypothetical protein GCG54_00011667 [Colletotrichum gloeosporioides]